MRLEVSAFSCCSTFNRAHPFALSRITSRSLAYQKQIVSRHFVAAFAVRGSDIYLAKGSAPSEAWEESAPLLLGAVQSFGLPPVAAG
jgi:hypothetical protein